MTAIGTTSALHADATLSTVDRLRRKGVRAWAVTMWVGLAILLVVDLAGGGGFGTLLLVTGALVNALPTYVALRGRYDAAARMMMGAPAAFLPAMTVFLLQGHPWQMDAHMYFFVAMAGLALLGDWRPIAVATVLTACHHLLLEWLAPAYVFTGSGNLGRVVFHVVAVGLQAALLSTLAVWLERLLNAQDAAIRHAEDLARAAEAGETLAREAMEIARAAEAQAAAERHAREATARRVADERRGEFVTLANEFQWSVTGVVKAVTAAIERLEKSVERLDESTTDANAAASDVAAGASDAATEIAQVAQSIRDLSDSIQTIAIASAEQSRMTDIASGEADRSVARIAALEGKATLIEELVEDIREIAGKTNLLALNATIEAARAGEAGRGFTVVAGEVKSLAGDTTRASDKISALLAGIRTGVIETGADLRGVNEAIGDVTAAACGIEAAVEEQRVVAQTIDASAERAMQTAADIEGRIGEVATAASLAATLCGALRGSASELSASARDLRGATDQFLTFLHDEPAIAA